MRVLLANGSPFSHCYIQQADDGSTALEVMKKEREAGETFDFILIDFIMVVHPLGTSAGFLT
jgi:hypothetical protein